MTVELFAALAAGCAMAILLVVELRVPFEPVRRWLSRGRHVVAERSDGPWFVVEWDRETYSWFRVTDDAGEPVPHPAPEVAQAHLTGPERARAWLADLAQCPWCSGAYVTAAALGVTALAYGADVAWFWLPLWWCSSALVVVLGRVAE